MNIGKTIKESNLPKKENEELGKRIKEARKSKKLTQKQLALKIGIAESTMGGIESGRRPPTPIVKRKICEELNISNLLNDSSFDLVLFNMIQETLCMFILNKNELDFIIEELKIRFGFDILEIPIIEDEMFELNRKKLKSINKERQIYIKEVIKNILELISSLYKVNDKMEMFYNFSYYLINFYKRDFENLLCFPTEYAVMLGVYCSNERPYTELPNKENKLQDLEISFKRYMKNKYFYNNKVYRFDYENNKEIFYKVRGKINGYYSIQEKISTYAENRNKIFDIYNNSFYEYETVKEFQLQILEILKRLDKSYILYNNPIPIHILPKYNIIDGYENLNVKLASDEYTYIAIKIGKQLSHRYRFYNESDVITVQLGTNYEIDNDVFIWNKLKGFDIGRITNYTTSEICIKNDLGERKYNIEDLKSIGIITNVNKIYYKNIEKNLKK